MQVTKIIEIHPSLLTSNLTNEIISMVNTKYIKTCTKEYGYIVSIRNVRVKEIKADYMSPMLHAKVVFSAEVTKPDVGSKVNVKVCKKLKHGLMTQTDFYRVFIPDTNNQYTDGDCITVEITAIQFDKNQYNCIGKIL